MGFQRLLAGVASERSRSVGDMQAQRVVIDQKAGLWIGRPPFDPQSIARRKTGAIQRPFVRPAIALLDQEVLTS